MPRNIAKFSFIVPSEKISIQVIMLGYDVYEIQINETISPENKTLPKSFQYIYDQFEAYLNGEAVIFDISLYWNRSSAFQQKVYRELMRVPAGEVISYGDLAERIGGKNYARAVAQAMRHNPFPVVVPCHRVVAANGPGGFSSGLENKRKLLEIENYSRCTELFG